MRRMLYAGALVVVVAMPTAQQTGARTLSGRTTDTSNSVLPGVTITITGHDVGRQVVSGADGEYIIGDLAPGAYAVTAELTGFLTRNATVEIRAAQDATLDFRLPVGCIGESSPPLMILLPFALQRRDIDLVVQIRIADFGGRERLTTHEGCWLVRRYVGELIDTIVGVAPRSRLSSTFRFYSHSWDPLLMPGDELIAFLSWNEETASYHELEHRYRLHIRGGLVEWMTPPEWPQIDTGTSVGGARGILRAAFSRR